MYTYKHGDTPSVCRHLTPMQIDIRNRDHEIRKARI